MKTKFIAILGAVFLLTTAARAQTTAFAYQGKLTDNGTAQSIYQMQFRLFASAGGSDQIGATVTNGGVAVTNGVFTVTLDFGAPVFLGADRFLEIAVRRNTNESYTILNPRQQIHASPYSIRTLSAAQADVALDSDKLGGVPASEYVTTASVGNSFIKNATTPQPTANFNIGGTGAANIFDAGVQFNLDGQRVLSGAGSSNFFAGFNAGQNNTGSNNSFFGGAAGIGNVGGFNTSVGNVAGGGKTSGASFNSFFGYQAGNFNNAGANNTFIGANTNASANPASGNNNTLVGANALVNNALNNATAVGFRASVTQSISLVLGCIGGINGASSSVNVGIGTTAPVNKLQIIDPSNTGLRVQTDAAGGTVASFGGLGAFQVDAPNVVAGRLAILENGNVGIGNAAPSAKLEISGSNALELSGTAPYTTFVDTSAANLRGRIQNIGGSLYFYTANDIGGTASIVMDNAADLVDINSTVETGTLRFTPPFNGANVDICGSLSNSKLTLSTCSSARRYKTDFQPFVGGMNFINRLSPMTYRWKMDGTHDLGFVAEEVAEVEPLLATRNPNGEIEGVKYDRLSTVFVNAFKEQQAQIEAQAGKIEQQQRQIEQLKNAMCAANPQMKICLER